MSETTAPSSAALREAVRTKYASVAQGATFACCGPAGDAEVNMIGDAYDGVDGYEASADLGLGCGLPVEHAGLAPGQAVLDLGSGAGLDAFVARRVVGETGRVVGIDFTPEMVARAEVNAAALGYENVAFVQGDIEALPLPAAAFDVVVSNCVLNLVPDKAQAFAEMHRVLKPGGHFCVSDVVTRGELPAAVRASAELYAGCVAGAMDQSAYLGQLTEAGFEAVEVVAERAIDVPAEALPALTVDERAAYDAAGLYSVTVRGTRPGGLSAGKVEAKTTLQVYDPPQCCSTGVCGPDVDPALVQFAADLSSLTASGVAVERYNLAQEPEAFVREPAVVQAVNTLGTGVLPLILIDGRVASYGRYPSQSELVALVAEAGAAAEAPVTLDLLSDGDACCGPGSSCCGPGSSCC